MSDGVVQYKFLSLVGEGGFGKVYRARFQTGGFSKDVAIKLLSDPSPPQSLLERFRDEANILGLIRDRAIVRVEPPVQISGRWAVVMEFVDGVSCGLMLGQGRLPPGVAVEIVGEVARALHAAYHQEGPEGEPLQLLHRDVKPENIQITPSGDVRLLDFGIAKANFAAREFKTRHSLGGTPGYIAPERLNRVEVPEGDVFSLGVVLHELITGDRPKHPPTVEVDTQVQLESEDEIPYSGIQVDDEELEAPEDLRDDPLVMAVLRLAAWMRAYDPSTRPSAREVEEACRQFRLKLPPPFFRNWAEAKVPHRMELDADEMVGQVLHTQQGTSTPLVIGRPLTDPGGPSTQAPITNPTTSNFFVALLGSGVAMMIVLGGGAVLVALLIGVFLASRGSSEPMVDGTPARPLAEVATPESQGTSDALPTPEDDPQPAIDPLAVEAPDKVTNPPEPPSDPKPSPVPVKPAPTPVSTPERPVIVLGASAPEAAPAQVDELQVRERPTGRLVLKTVPGGATLYENGERVARSGRGYEFPIGSHTVMIESTTGERHKLAFTLKSNEQFTVCYNFDTNRRCDGSSE
ncbi:MAG: serine/threonine-protein kinase [Myxococcota bacterium]